MKLDPGFRAYIFRACFICWLMLTQFSCAKENDMGTAIPASMPGGSTPPTPPAVPPPPAPQFFNFSIYDTLSIPRNFLATGTAGSKVLFVGGMNGKYCYVPGGDYGDSILTFCISNQGRVDIFDTATNLSTTYDLPRHYSGMQGVTVGDKVFFAAGTTIAENAFSNKIDVYEASRDSWSTIDMPETRYGMGIGKLGNKIFFAGGLQVLGFQNFVLSNRVDIYDVSTNGWSVARLSEARCSPTVISSHEKLFFAGGDYGGWAPVSATVDIFDAATNTWSTSQLSEARSGPSAVSIGQKTYFVGGRRGFNIDPSRSLDIYDHASHSWSARLINFLMESSYPVVKETDAYFFTKGTAVQIYQSSTDSWISGRANQGPDWGGVIYAGGGLYYAGGGVAERIHNQVFRIRF